jgi:(4S)-4-hydroxy-5-phosphonooxypentane-2,3-dione isomerase
MIVTIVHVWVLAEFVDDFVRASLINHEHSVKEPGNFRFDFLQDEADRCKFVLYEAYESEAHASAHKKTDHYLNWRETVEPWMARPRQGIRHNMVSPRHT